MIGFLGIRIGFNLSGRPMVQIGRVALIWWPWRDAAWSPEWHRFFGQRSRQFGPLEVRVYD